MLLLVASITLKSHYYPSSGKILEDLPMTKKSGATKDRMSRLLLEYLKDSSRSDRELAKVLGVSQPTISRMKRRLVEEGIVNHFSAIPDLAEMGYEIMAFSLVKFNMEQFVKFSGEDPMKIVERAKKWAHSYPCVIFDSRARGMGVDSVTISVHKDYAAYQDFLTENKKKWGPLMAEVQYILVDLKGDINKPLSFKYLAEKPEK